MNVFISLDNTSRTLGKRGTVSRFCLDWAGKIQEDRTCPSKNYAGCCVLIFCSADFRTALIKFLISSAGFKHGRCFSLCTIRFDQAAQYVA